MDRPPSKLAAYVLDNAASDKILLQLTMSSVQAQHGTHLEIASVQGTNFFSPSVIKAA